MGRPADPLRRERTLTRATDYVLANGLAGLSLRPLAAALGTSTRMLLYDFASKEELIASVLAEARRREASLLAEYLAEASPAPDELVRAVWTWISATERASFLRLFFQVYVDAMTGAETYGDQGVAMITDWLDTMGAAFAKVAPGLDDTSAPTLIIAVIRGLLLDQLLTGDVERTGRALEGFLGLLAARSRAGSTRGR